ncbi:hypothetical protein J4401_05020 [Candidatus Woesearchaeota archaeon]|nr:hypothetical protein [Candidatus Woesearchaeota archaeon]
MLSKDTRIYLEIEKSKIQREKARLVLEKSVALYMIFMIIGVLGFFFGYLTPLMLNAMIILGIIILITGSIPYMRLIKKEERKIDKFLKE